MIQLIWCLMFQGASDNLLDILYAFMRYITTVDKNTRAIFVDTASFAMGFDDIETMYYTIFTLYVLATAGVPDAKRLLYAVVHELGRVKFGYESGVPS